MRTEAQNRASRKNGAKSLGPLTDAGKAASSMNSLRTGIYAEAEIIQGENPADLETLTAEFYEEFDPQTPSHRALVDSATRATWNLRRLARADAQLWNEDISRSQRRDGNSYPLGDACHYGAGTQERLQRRLNAVHRILDRDLKILSELKKRRNDEKRAEAPVPAGNDAALNPPTPDPSVTPTNDSPVGFAPSNSEPLAEASLVIPKPPTRAPQPFPTLDERRRPL